MSELKDIKVELATMLAQVDQSTAITTEEMAATQAYLGQLYDKAAEAHDEQALVLISETWTHIQAVAEQNAALTFQVVASGNMTQAALAETKLEREARQELEDAIDANDDSHPKLQDFAEYVREEAIEDFDERVQEELWPEAYEAAGEDLSENYLDMITTITGCSWQTASHFKAMLDGWHKPTEYQLELFKALMVAFEQPSQEVQRGA